MPKLCGFGTGHQDVFRGFSRRLLRVRTAHLFGSLPARRLSQAVALSRTGKTLYNKAVVRRTGQFLDLEPCFAVSPKLRERLTEKTDSVLSLRLLHRKGKILPPVDARPEASLCSVSGTNSAFLSGWLALRVTFGYS